ncbi:MAG TPA: sigma-54 dependent transcriptional regulator [Labilithrix sp.]|nr:sigma-54 dependent transcriptional regulator [Labilithrix sp.]
MPGERILVIDDDAALRFGIKSYFGTKGFVIEESSRCDESTEAFRSFAPDLVISDFNLPDGDGLDVLRQLRQIDASVPVVVLSGFATIDLAVQSIKEGAEQFLTKPVEMSALHVLVERLLGNRRSESSRSSRGSEGHRQHVDIFRGNSAAIRNLEAQARRVLPSRSPIFLHGETGVGKGLLARWIHQNSPRGAQAFVDINCAGLTQELLDSELFGHERGAFTGAVATKRGLLEVAHHGTLFLDEIGDMPNAVQSKLLKVLEDMRFRRLGELHDRRVDVRLITATHHDLESLVAQGRFREDLYYRIGILPLVVPTLRERPEDIAMLAQDFADSVTSELGRPRCIVTAEGVSVLESHGWPGNIRELRNTIERAVLMAEGRTIGHEELAFIGRTRGASDAASPGQPPLTGAPSSSGGPSSRPPSSAPPAPRTSIGPTSERRPLADVEREHVIRVLTESGGQIDVAAQWLGIARSSLYNKVRRWGLKPPYRST